MRLQFARAGRFGLRLLSTLASRNPSTRGTRNESRPKPILEQLESREVPAVAQPQYLLMNHAGGAQPLFSSSPTGLTPAQVRHAYGFDQITFNNGTVAGDGSGETIAIIDAYDDPTAATDLQQFDATFGLPNPTFTKVNQTGGNKMPTGNTGWAVEISLDVQWAHAIAPKANILLVEANSNSTSDLFAAVRYAAAQPGVVAVSMSWAGSESSGESSSDSTFTTPSGHAGVTFLASSGDSGAPTVYPSASPNVVSVGGTTLSINSSGTYLSESAWGGSGGGISAYESQPTYQKGIVTQTTTKRADPDVSYDSNPSSGFPVYDTYSNGTSTPWEQVGGTSDAAPQWAALIAIADQGLALNGVSSLDGRSQTLPLLYQMSSSDFHDITSGTTTGSPNYSAGPGYDLATGRGTPIANLVVSDLVNPSTIIDNGQSGYSETGSGWSSYGAGYGGSLRDVAPGSGANTATWSFTGLASGSTFNAQVDWLADPNNRASNVTYTVYDGSTFLGSATIDQRQNPVGTTVGGVTFQSLGTFTVTSGTLRIVVSDNANGLVIADAARLTVATPTSQTLPPIIDFGQSGYSETGSGWSSYGAGYGGSLRDVAPGSGANTVSWSFTGLTAGTTFSPSVDWLADPNNRASNATYQVYDGSNLIGTVVVNQRQNPVGTALGGVTFQSLGNFTISSGTLTIVLSDNANGLIIADAARLIVVTAPTPPTLTLPAVIDNGQSGYTEVGSGWASYNGAGYGGSLRVVAAGSGANTVTWSFTGLSAGTYNAAVDWLADPNNRASNATYQVYDGSTLLGTVTINQQQSPVGTTVGGVIFQSLGRFTISSGTLNIVLSDNANGLIIADAARLTT